MEPTENRVIKWYLNFEENLSLDEKLAYFPHPSDPDFWNRADNREEKKALKEAREFRLCYLSNFQKGVPILAEWTKEEIDRLPLFQSVMIGERHFNFSGAMVCSFIILCDDGIHIFTKTHTNTALGLLGLAASAIKNKGKNYTHEIIPIQTFLSTLKTYELGIFPYRTFIDFCKQTYGLILPANLKHFRTQCQARLEGPLNKSSGVEETELGYISELTQLKKLLDDGVINENEFSERKKHILERLNSSNSKKD